MIIRSIFEILYNEYDGEKTVKRLLSLYKSYPILIKDFLQHINQFSEIQPQEKKIASSLKRYKNIRIYGKLDSDLTYAQAIIDYISGMTDRYAITIFSELIKY